MGKAEKFWDKQADKYVKTEKKYEQNYIKTVANTKKYLNTSDIVLDYGCGTGLITNELACNVKEIHASDISARMIEVAKLEASKRGIYNIDYAQATIFDDRYYRESFDTVMTFNVLHLLEDAQEVMSRINELLKPGGTFISTTACLGQKRSILSILILLLTKIRVTPYVKHFKISELEALISNGNFQIVETETLSHSPVNHFVVAKKI